MPKYGYAAFRSTEYADYGNGLFGNNAVYRTNCYSVTYKQLMTHLCGFHVLIVKL